MTKIVVIGGSSVGTPALVSALLTQFTASPTSAITLTLHGRNPQKLAPVVRTAQLLAQGQEWLTVEGSTDLPQALDGATYIVNQVRVGGLAARADDETFPLTLGLLGEETVGAGGFANAMRTVPAVVQIAHKIERYAPNALLLSFTNPASVIQYAVTQTTRLKVIGLCDAAITMTAQAASTLNCNPRELDIDYVGMHHFSFIPRIFRSGQDMTGAMLTNLERIGSLDMDPDVVRTYGVLPTPYFKYFLHPDRMLARQRQQTQSRGAQLLDVEAKLLKDYATLSGDALRGAVAQRSAKWYDAIIAPVVATLIEGRTQRFVLNIVNSEVVPWLPHDAIVETGCVMQAGRVFAALPVDLVPISKDLMARIQLNCAYEQLVVEAALERNPAKALRALLMNPLIPSADAARAVIKHVFSTIDQPTAAM